MTLSKLTELALPNAGAARFGKEPPGLQRGRRHFAKATREFDLLFILNSWSPGISHERRSPGAFLGLSIRFAPRTDQERYPRPRGDGEETYFRFSTNPRKPSAKNGGARYHAACEFTWKLIAPTFHFALKPSLPLHSEVSLFTKKAENALQHF